MFCLNKFKQLNIFEQVSELKNMTTKQPVGFVKLLADNFDINTFIPLNPRNQGNSKIGDLEYNIEGIPLCPLTKELFKSEGSCKGKNRSLRFKFTCPKSHRDKQCKCYHTCENPCTDAKSGRMTYVYPDKDFRLYPGIQRNSSEWDKTYHIRAGIKDL